MTNREKLTIELELKPEAIEFLEKEKEFYDVYLSLKEVIELQIIQYMLMSELMKFHLIACVIEEGYGEKFTKKDRRRVKKLNKLLFNFITNVDVELENNREDWYNQKNPRQKLRLLLEIAAEQVDSRHLIFPEEIKELEDIVSNLKQNKTIQKFDVFNIKSKN